MVLLNWLKYDIIHYFVGRSGICYLFKKLLLVQLMHQLTNLVKRNVAITNSLLLKERKDLKKLLKEGTFWLSNRLLSIKRSSNKD